MACTLWWLPTSMAQSINPSTSSSTRVRVLSLTFAILHFVFTEIISPAPPLFPHRPPSIGGPGKSRISPSDPSTPDYNLTNLQTSFHDEESDQQYFTRYVLLGIVILIALILVVISMLWVFTMPMCNRHQTMSEKLRSKNIQGSWESEIDSNHNSKHRGRSGPLHLLSSMHNWFNRKKRILQARRTRRSTKQPAQPQSRATMYYNNGRMFFNNEPNWSNNSNRTPSKLNEKDSEAMATLLSVPKSQMPPIDLVSNPNYFSENEQRLLENTCKFYVRQKTIDVHVFSSLTAIRHIINEKISLIKELGEGAFGRVYLGTVDYLEKDEPTTLVAIKMLKETQNCEFKAEFAREAEMLSSLVNANIVTFYGISLDGTNLMMIFEYMEYGDLNNFLRERDPFTHPEHRNDCNLNLVSERERYKTLQLTDLLHIATQIANGMEYLAGQHFVHRDLATRNCLVGLGLVTKIGDFGMSRDVYATDYYRVSIQNRTKRNKNITF